MKGLISMGGYDFGSARSCVQRPARRNTSQFSVVVINLSQYPDTVMDMRPQYRTEGTLVVGDKARRDPVPDGPHTTRRCFSRAGAAHQLWPGVSVHPDQRNAGRSHGATA
jgi:hypothetical protein